MKVGFHYPINEHHKPFVTLGLGIQKITDYKNETIHMDGYKDFSGKSNISGYSFIYKLGLGYEYTLNKNNSFVLNTSAMLNNKLFIKKENIKATQTIDTIQQDKFQATYNLGVAYKYTFDNR